MSTYHEFATTRQTEPDPATLLTQLRGLDPTVGVQHQPGPSYTLKQATAWTPAHIAAAQIVLENAAAASLTAQAEIDSWSIAIKALVPGLIDQMNVLRAALPAPLPPITAGQALAAIRTKAGTR